MNQKEQELLRQYAQTGKATNQVQWKWALAFLICFFPCVAFNAWALCKIWQWHIFPTWGIPGPELWTAMILILTISFLTKGRVQTKTTDEEDFVALIDRSIRAGMVLLLAWILS
jgi:Flp pilus assembly protein TadB